MPVDLYYSTMSAPCRAVMLTGAALDIKLNLIKINPMEKEHVTPEFLKMNPQHTIPTIVDDGFSLWESRAISRYLVNKYGGDSTLYPKDPKARAVIDQRLDFDLGTLYDRYVQYIYPQYTDNASPNEAAFKKLQEALKLLNTFLDGNKYVAGPELTIADLSLIATVSTMEVTNTDITQYPNIVKWYNLLKSTLPNYKEVNQKGVDDMKVHVADFLAKKSQGK